ncbi:MAG: Hsp20/alpha crystallin family protein [Caldilineales bacterium]|nr:Hsp20/alpha crystallin family protein [Caldilineales bacterium]
MRMIVRRDPMYREMNAWRSAMDRLFEEVAENTGYWERPANWALALDVLETPEAFTVKASVPGINPDDLDITLTDNVLTIKGEVQETQEVEEANWHLRERRFGSFQRSITLPTPVNADAIEATYVDGVLTLTVPKAEEIKPKRIAVKAAQEVVS